MNSRFKAFPQGKYQGQMVPLMSYKTILRKEEGIVLNSFYVAHITLILKPKTDQKKKRLIFLMNINTKIRKLNKVINKKDNTS